LPGCWWEDPAVRLAARLTLMAAAVAYGAAVAFAVPRSSIVPTTYADASGLASALDLAAGVGLIAAGIALWSARAHGSLGPLAIAAGVVWLAPNWIGWEGGPAVGRSLAMVIALYLPVLLMHIVTGAPKGRLPGRPARAAVAAAYVVTTVVALGRALVRDPFEDPYCWSNCTDNVFLVHADRGIARALDDAWLLVAAVLGAAVVLATLWRLVRASTPGRRALLPVAVPAVALAAGECGYALALTSVPMEDPERAGFAGLFLWRAAAATGLALGFGWLLARRQRTRGIVARLAAELRVAPTPGTLRETLAAAVGDPDLEVTYWLAAEERFVDGSGAPVTPPSEGATTPILRDGRLVAVLSHDASVPAADLERQIGAAARLAIENERLRAEALAQLAALTALRRRIVETGDEERRRLERDLHDGAQQRLLALSYDLRLAAEDAPVLAAAVEEGHAALADVRDLATGIHPAILTEAGLGPALETLADTAPVALELAEMPAARYAAAVETTAYLLLADQVTRCDRGVLRVRVAAGQGELDVEVHDAREVPTHLADRVAALGGRVELRDRTVRASIPCA
jgi:signal transduction histidine kinase